MSKKDREDKKYVHPLIVVVATIVGLIVTFLLFVVITRSIDTFVPYSFKHYDTINNPNKFNPNIAYGTYDVYEPSNGTSDARRVFDETGIQLYTLSFKVPENVYTKNDVVEYVQNYIDTNIGDEYGVYLVNMRWETYPHEDDVSNAYDMTMYNQLFIGDEADAYMDANATKIYDAAWHRYDEDWFNWYLGTEIFVKAMSLMATRTQHPIRSVIPVVLFISIFIAAIIYAYVQIKKRIEHKRTIEILETPMDDLVDEKVDEIANKYK